MNANFSNKILELAWAMTGFEGFLNGEASYNNKNQGNIRYGNYSIKLGATSESPAGFARFPSYQAGFQALCQFLTDAALGANQEYEPAMTIGEFVNTYAPSSDDNNPGEYAVVICIHAGLHVTDTLGSLLN